MDKQREMFEDWFDSTYITHNLGYSKLDMFAAWQAAQKVQWQPIETAPVGVDVLVSRDFGKPPVVAGYFEETDEWLAFDDPFTPLHGLTSWAPLPQEPNK